MVWRVRSAGVDRKAEGIYARPAVKIWTMEEIAEGERFLACGPLKEAGLPHAFTLKPSVPSSGGRRPGPPTAIARHAGLDSGSRIAVPRQVHGRTVAVAAEDGRTHPLEADAILVAKGGAAAVATADCVGAVIFDPASGAFAVVHAGWRGTLAGIVEAAVGRLVEVAAARAESLILAMGPAIGGCCYEVGEEVAALSRAAFTGAGTEGIFGTRAGKTMIDLAAANRLRAIRSGMQPDRIYAAGICTACRPDLCCSYRSSGDGAGRMWTIAGRPR